MIRSFAELRTLAATMKPRTIAVVSPENPSVLKAVSEIGSIFKTRAILFGNAGEIKKLAPRSKCEIVDEPAPLSAAASAVKAVRTGRADILVKGVCPTSDYMKAILDRGHGLRREDAVMAQVFAFSTDRSNGIKLLSDAAINISPNADEKAAMAENAVRFARAVGCARPAVAMLASLEKENPRMPDTVDAAKVAAMKSRWDSLVCDVAGPISVDLAVSAESSAVKGFSNPVAGSADIFIAPDLASANLFAKGIIYFAHTESGGIVLGGSAPIALRSRSDTVEEKINSVAMAIIAAEKLF
jgi:phosphate butyryltransferase